MKFKLDEHLPLELADSLGKAGFDASTVLAEDLRGCSDADLISVCRTEGRALITLDLGFGDIRAYPPETSPGIIVLRLARRDKTHVLAVATHLSTLFQSEPLNQRLWIVEEHRVRIRG